MDYNLLICVADKYWTAIDINVDGECDRISFDGNETMVVDTGETVKAFCTQMLNYYNIDGFSDIALNIKIVLISAYSNLITDLFMQVRDAKSINVVDAKSIIPIHVLKNCIVKPGGVIDVKCMEEEFTLQVRDDLVVSYVPDKAGEEIVMEPECFSMLFRFNCKNLISDEAELRAMKKKCIKDAERKQKEIDKQKKLYSELKKKYDELEKNNRQLQNEVEESKSRFDDKRTILWFTTDQLKESNSYTPFAHSLFALSLIMNDGNKKYICKLLKADGDVVKKGTELIEIVESYTMSDGKSCDTGKQCVIKANTDGRIFYLVKNGDNVKDNEAVVMLSDSADKRTDIMKWYEEMKEICDESDSDMPKMRQGQYRH